MIITKENVKSSLPNTALPQDFKLEINIDDQVLINTEVNVCSNYYDSFRIPQKVASPMRLGDYFALNDDNITELCPEFPINKEIAKNISLQIATTQSDSAVSLLHAGRKGCMAPVHYDWDNTYVLHVCLTGQKTFFFFPPSSGWLLSPTINTSALCIPRFSIEDQESILKSLNGYKVTLQRGDTVLFPSIWWHSVLYEADSIGLSIRFNSSVLLRPFGALPRSWWLQRLVWELFKMPEKKINTILEQCLQTFFANYPNWMDRYKSMNELYRKLLVSLGQSNGTKNWIGDNFNSEVLLAGFELERFYTLPTESKGTNASEEYLFEGFQNSTFTYAGALANYAMDKRIGLQPKSGLIPMNKFV